MIATGWRDYEVIATSCGEKLERWGDVYLLRPDPQVIWKGKDLSTFKGLNAHYHRSESGGGSWEYKKKTPAEWRISYRDLNFIVKPMGFKHVGLFPEQSANWDKMRAILEGKEANVLNLFGYTGGATVACAKSGAKVTHVDAAKAMVDRCKQNAEISGIASDRIRYIVDDCMKFVGREIKRGKKYDAVIMDPPSYGRGPNGEMWKIEDGLYDLIKLTTAVLSDRPLFYLINSYTTGLQPSVLDNMLSLLLPSGKHEGYELCLPTSEGIVLPAGASGFWRV
ncbi:MAG: class I SAM-dependent methyltransferase [Clostridiales bacterium]|nr:class I SAM-dependent methyltransferase [Clostridiales bacterium]